MASLAPLTPQSPTRDIFIREDDPGLPMDSLLVREATIFKPLLNSLRLLVPQSFRVTQIPRHYNGMIESIMISHGLIIGTPDLEITSIVCVVLSIIPCF